MRERSLITAFGTSLVIHLGLLPIVSLIIYSKPVVPALVPVELLEFYETEATKKLETMAPPPAPKAKPQKIIAPKLLSKPELFDIKPIGNARKETKEPEKPLEPPPQVASLPPDPVNPKADWNDGTQSAEAKGGAKGAATLFSEGDAGAEAGGGGRGAAGLGPGTKGEGTRGGGAGSGGATAGLARPLGGYQVRPNYPESARRAGAQGTTLLKLRVLETGRVGEIVVEQSSGHRDLDSAAADAVKKWLFEPARMGQEPIAVWVLLPVRFELKR